MSADIRHATHTSRGLLHFLELLWSCFSICISVVHFRPLLNLKSNCISGSHLRKLLWTDAYVFYSLCICSIVSNFWCILLFTFWFFFCLYRLCAAFGGVIINKYIMFCFNEFAFTAHCVCVDTEGQVRYWSLTSLNTDDQRQSLQSLLCD